MSKKCLRYDTCEDILYDIWAPIKNKEGTEKVRALRKDPTKSASASQISWEL